MAQEQASARADAAVSEGAARVSRIRDELRIPMLALFDIAAQLQSPQSAESERVTKYTLMNALNVLNATFKSLTSSESERDNLRATAAQEEPSAVVPERHVGDDRVD